MSSKKYVPTLSDDGWTDSNNKVADYLFSHFFLSDYSQSYLYIGHVSSMAWIIQNTQGSMSDTTTLVQQTLSDYFSRYFNNVVSEVKEIPNPTDPSVGQISIYVSFTDIEGNKLTLGKMIQVTDSTISKIIDINNGTNT